MKNPNPKTLVINFKQYFLESANFAQQAAIAINMKKHHKKPKNKGKKKKK